MAILEEEELRASYYIHTPDNRNKYIACVNKNLLEYRLPDRIKKNDGLKTFLESYEEGKEDFEKEIK